MKKAEIKWLAEKDGGKKNIPCLDVKYYPMLKLEGAEKILNWSFVVINREIINSYLTISEVYFLMDNAPHNLLKEGTVFKLFEGSHFVAEGKIL